MARIVAVVAQKGGVGKTSLVQNVGFELSTSGSRVLLVDFDPQSNLSESFGLDPNVTRPTVYDALVAPESARGAVLNLRDNLDLLPADLDLAGAELQFAGDFDRNGKLRDGLEGLRGDYDVIMIDCPPSLGFFSANAMIAATEIIAPMQCEFFALKAMAPLMELIEKAQKGNRGLVVRAIVPTMSDNRTSLSKPVEEAARAQYGALVSATIIPRNVRIADAPVHGLAVAEHDKNSTGALAYRELTKELFNHG